MQYAGQWMTVREFAQSVRMSPQAIYQRLDKDLSSYLKTEKGRKYINSDALELFHLSSDCQEKSSACQSVDNQAENELRDIVKRQEAELEQLRRDNAALTAVLDAERRRADDLNTALQAALQSLQAEQALHAAAISQQKQIETSAEETEPAEPAQDGKKRSLFEFFSFFRKGNT